MRRQNRSCDQCRKAKRACDAPSLWDIKRNPGRVRPEGDAGAAVSLAEEHIEDIDSRALRCSYCLRTRKQCTFHWVRAQLQTGPAAATAGEVPTTTGNGPRRIPDPAKSKAKRQRIKNGNGTTTTLPTSIQAQNLDVNTTALLDILQMPPNNHDMNAWGPMENGFNNIPAFPTTTFDSMPTNGVFDPTAFDAGFHPSVLNGIDGIDMNGAAGHPSPIDLSPGSDLSHHSLHTHNAHAQAQHPVTDEENGNDHSSNWPIFQQSHHPHTASDAPFQPSPSVSHSYESDNSSRAAVSMRHYSESLSRAYGSSISPYSATNAMVTVTNRNLISDNLMKIYHDVLEHALSCWISEETCPYKITPNAPKVNGVTWLSDGFEKLNILDHYEPSYQENRVYRRVMKLDRVAQKNKLIQLTKSEDRAASKALNLAIMAFATQWAQSSNRGREKFPSSLHALENRRSEAEEMSEDFDRTLQRTFWAQAKRALADASDLECFRVVCADLIFGLAQKPMEEDESNYESSYGMFDGAFDVASSVSSGSSSGDQSVACQISELIAKEGPPVFMERAARKMHALKFQVEAREAGVLDGSKSSLGLEKSTKGEILSPEDRDTVGLVYWMTVMFDTVSSSMNGRPVVVSDEECQHDPSYHENLEHEAKVEFQLHDARWWEEVVTRDSVEGGIRFPCSYELATKGVIAAAPTKVLLFRHVSYLQNIVRSKRRGEPVEKIILNAMAVYRHWRVNYSAFFRDLVEHYDLVPGYIQSWFVCVAAHFHLAALLMIDLVELVDENNLGIEYASQVRISTNVVARLRKDSAGVLSDLARVSTAARSGDVPGSNSELHFAIVEGSILTEPWTMILLRGFTKAAMITLTEAEDIVRSNPTSLQDPARLMDAVKRCEDCTKALYCLGKKSDMARNIAVVLTGALSPFLMRSPMNIITA